jgi:hypothetical protein
MADVRLSSTLADQQVAAADMHGWKEQQAITTP